MAGRLAGKLHYPRDRRSIGRSEEVVRDVLAAPERFSELFDAMLGPDPLVRMRAADAVEKITRRNPHLLAAHKRRLLDEVALVPQHELRWHVAQLLPRLTLSPGERTRAVAVLTGYLEDHSRIVQAFALQALADLAMHDDALLERVAALARDLASTGSPAVRARSRMVLTQLAPGLLPDHDTIAPSRGD